MILAVIAVGAYFFLAPNTGFAAMVQSSNDANEPTLDELFQKWGAYFGVEWQLLKAHAIVESSLDPNAVNETDNESIGLMQILCRPDGNGGCMNRLNVEGWSEATREKLFNPDFNIRIGAGILAWNIRHYGLPRGIAMYNRYAEKDSPIGGPFQNQAYVDKVLSNYRRITT